MSCMFQALQYLLKLCSHPLLVVGEKMPEILASQLSELFPASSDIISELHKLHHSPKLVALQEILEECGIGIDTSSSENAMNVGQHRVLIFAQHKVMNTSCSFLFFIMLFLACSFMIFGYCGILCRPCLTLLKETCFTPIWRSELLSATVKPSFITSSHEYLLFSCLTPTPSKKALNGD